MAEIDVKRLTAALEQIAGILGGLQAQTIKHTAALERIANKLK